MIPHPCTYSQHYSICYIFKRNETGREFEENLGAAREEVNKIKLRCKDV